MGNLFMFYVYVFMFLILFYTDHIQNEAKLWSFKIILIELTY